jgi:hypothetical protein
MGTINLDTITTQYGMTKPHINVQPEYLLADGTIDPAKCGLDKIKAFVSNNILWTDTVALAAYYHNKAVGGFGPYGTDYPGDCPASYLTWTGKTPPFRVVNIPSIWMNSRTAGLFDGTYPFIVQANNHINVEVNTVTPAIKDAATADQMALWDAGQWGVPGIAANDILHSGYIFGDFDPTTIPGYKTEDGSGITKLTDLNDNFALTTPIISTIDGKAIGALHWTSDIDSYNSADAYAAVIAKYHNLGGTAVGKTGLDVPGSYKLSQNYPNPFNPTTTINFNLAKASDVKLTVYNMLGQKVMTLVDSHLNAGEQTVKFDASKLTSGVYFYRLDAGSFSSVKKMMLLK